MKETPKAKRALEDYWEMGPDRSLAKLVKGYQKESARNEQVPTTNEGTVYEWSRQHNWQERIKQRIDEDAQAIRKRLRERAVKFRERVAGAIYLDVSRLLQRLAATDGEVLAQSATDVEKLVKLFYQVAETPLSERHEIDADVKHTGDTDAIEELNRRITRIATRIREGEDTE